MQTHREKEEERREERLAHDLRTVKDGERLSDIVAGGHHGCAAIVQQDIAKA